MDTVNYGCAPLPETSADKEFAQKFYSSESKHSYNKHARSYADDIQLERNSLMPKTWQDQHPSKASPTANEPPKGSSSWAQYSVSPAAFGQYIQTSGPIKFQSQLRPSINSKIGAPSLLRTQPAQAFTTTDPWFGGSSHRQDLIHGLPDCKDSYAPC